MECMLVVVGPQNTDFFQFKNTRGSMDYKNIILCGMRKVLRSREEKRREEKRE